MVPLFLAFISMKWGYCLKLIPLLATDCPTLKSLSHTHQDPEKNPVLSKICTKAIKRGRLPFFLGWLLMSHPEQPKQVVTKAVAGFLLLCLLQSLPQTGFL